MRLFTDPEPEARRRPLHKLSIALCVDPCPANPDIIGHRNTLVQEAAHHVFSVAGNAFDHRGRELEDRHGDPDHGQLFMVSILRRDDRHVAVEHTMSANNASISCVHVQCERRHQRC